MDKPGDALGTRLLWLEQPIRLSNAWKVHPIGKTDPDEIVGVCLANINNDGYQDVMIGGYSRGDRANDGMVKKNQSLGRIAWFEHPKDLEQPWIRHDVSRRIRGMFDKFIARDMDNDGDIDFILTRGNSLPYDGVFWLEQIRSTIQRKSFEPARMNESQEAVLPR